MLGLEAESGFTSNTSGTKMNIKIQKMQNESLSPGKKRFKNPGKNRCHQ